MYHTIVEKKLRHSFAELNRGNLQAIVDQFTPDAEHWFSGDHALAGRRVGTADIVAWYDRLGKVMPDLSFEICNVVVRGWPWRTVAMVEWVDSFTDPSGTRHSNQGTHVVHLAWGRITRLHIYCDTALLAGILADMAAHGRVQAAEAPIGSVEPFAVA